MRPELIYAMLPEPFSFYRAILNGDHLHFGLWPDNTVSYSLEEAQENMFNVLLSFFPAPPVRVLDVGCGLGYSAALLAQRGYQVTAIAPSEELIAYAQKHYGTSGVTFKVLSYLDEDESVFSREYYDVVLFQESMQYLRPLEKVIKRARHILRENGLIIIGDEVRYDRAITAETAVHSAADFTIQLSENGFRIMENMKVGENVKRTCNLLIDRLTRYHDALSSLPEANELRERLLFYVNGWRKQQQWYHKNQMGYEITVAKKDAFFIRPYEVGDEERILPLFNAIFHASRTLDHWHWKFRDCPYGSYKIALATDADLSIVAHYAGYPVPFCSALDTPKNFVSYQIGDTMTAPAVRHIGIGKTGLLSRTAHYFYAKFCDGAVPFIYGFNTGNIKKLGTRYLKYVYIDPVPYWIRDLRTHPLQRPSFTVRHFQGFAVEPIHKITQEYDDFFDRVISSYAFLVKRDSTYLKWRYLDCPDNQHQMFAIRKRGHLIGWSVFSKRDKKLIWGDALFDIDYPDALSYFLFTVVREYFSEVETIEGWFSPNPKWWSHLLKQLDFRACAEPNNLTPGFVFFDPSLTLEKMQRYLYYTMGDSDLF